MNLQNVSDAVRLGLAGDVDDLESAREALRDLAARYAEDVHYLLGALNAEMLRVELISGALELRTRSEEICKEMVAAS